MREAGVPDAIAACDNGLDVRCHDPVGEPAALTLKRRAPSICSASPCSREMAAQSSTQSCRDMQSKASIRHMHGDDQDAPVAAQCRPYDCGYFLAIRKLDASNEHPPRVVRRSHSRETEGQTAEKSLENSRTESPEYTQYRGICKREARYLTVCVLRKRTENNSEKLADSPLLINHHVLLVPDDTFVASTTVQSDTYEVAHCARRHKYRVFLAQDISSGHLELVDCGVLHIHVIADARIHHRTRHLCGWLGDGVATQVNRFFSPFTLRRYASSVELTVADNAKRIANHFEKPRRRLIR